MTEAERNAAREVVRQMIFEENRLRDQRLGYLLTLNGFLFAALAFAWDDKSQGKALVGLLGFVGILAGLSAQMSMRISKYAIKRLRDWSDCHTRRASDGECPTDSGQIETWERNDSIPPVVGMRGDHPDGLTQSLAPWNVLPWVLAVVWLAIVVVRLVR